MCAQPYVELNGNGKLTDADLFKHATITMSGAICLGRSVVCDGFESGFHAAAFTHVHSDHIGDRFETCMHNYPVYTSKITGDLLEAITEDIYSRRTQFNMINYNEPKGIRLNGHMDYLQLIESSHMLGASQILLVTHNGLRILYSGDISPQDVPPKCDVLVVDSTHGNSNLDKNIDSGSMERRLVDAVMENITTQNPVCIHAHRGKLQHIMHILSKHDEMPVDTKFLACKKEIRVAGVYNKHNYAIKNMVDIEDFDGQEIITGDYPWVEFNVSMHNTPREKKGKVTRITVSGSYMNTVMQQNEEKIWIASDEHAEFTDVLRYVKSAEPRVVITDSARTPHGQTLADEIVSTLGITAKPMPD